MDTTAMVSVLERCPFYKKTQKVTGKQQGPETFALAMELPVLCWCLLCIANKMLPAAYLILTVRVQLI